MCTRAHTHTHVHTQHSHTHTRTVAACPPPPQTHANKVSPNTYTESLIHTNKHTHTHTHTHTQPPTPPPLRPLDFAEASGVVYMPPTNTFWVVAPHPYPSLHELSAWPDLAPLRVLRLAGITDPEGGCVSQTRRFGVVVSKGMGPPGYYLQVESGCRCDLRSLRYGVVVLKLVPSNVHYYTVCSQPQGQKVS